MMEQPPLLHPPFKQPFSVTIGGVGSGGIGEPGGTGIGVFGGPGAVGSSFIQKVSHVKLSSQNSPVVIYQYLPSSRNS